MFELDNYSVIKQVYPFEWVMLGIYMLLIMGLAFYVKISNINKNKI